MTIAADEFIGASVQPHDPFIGATVDTGSNKVDSPAAQVDSTPFDYRSAAPSTYASPAPAPAATAFQTWQAQGTARYPLKTPEQEAQEQQTKQDAYRKDLLTRPRDYGHALAQELMATPEFSALDPQQKQKTFDQHFYQAYPVYDMSGSGNLSHASGIDFTKGSLESFAQQSGKKTVGMVNDLLGLAGVKEGLEPIGGPISENPANKFSNAGGAAFGGAAPLLATGAVGGPVAGAALGGAQAVGGTINEAREQGYGIDQTAALAGERGIANAALGSLGGEAAVAAGGKGLLAAAKEAAVTALKVHGLNVGMAGLDSETKNAVGMPSNTTQAVGQAATSLESGIQAFLFGVAHGVGMAKKGAPEAESILPKAEVNQAVDRVGRYENALGQRDTQQGKGIVDEFIGKQVENQQAHDMKVKAVSQQSPTFESAASLLPKESPNVRQPSPTETLFQRPEPPEVREGIPGGNPARQEAPRAPAPQEAALQRPDASLGAHAEEVAPTGKQDLQVQPAQENAPAKAEASPQAGASGASRAVEGTKETAPTQAQPDNSKPTQAVGAAHPESDEFSADQSGEGLPETASIKNAYSAENRKRLGLPDRDSPEGYTFNQVLDDGVAHAKDNPEAAANLLDELRTNPKRAINKEEVGLLTKQAVDNENRLQDLYKQVGDLYEKNDTEGEVLARAQLAAHMEVMREHTKLFEQAGSATSGGLNARRIVSKLDYSLSHMITEFEAAKGANASEAEIEEITRLQSQAQKHLDAISAADSEHTEQQAKEWADRHMEQMKQAVIKQASAPVEPHVKSLADRIVFKLDKLSNDAIARIKARGTKVNALGDPMRLVDETIVGTAELAKGLVKFADWSASMVAKLGDYIKPHLQEVFDRADKALNAHVEKLAGPKAKAVKATLSAKAPTDWLGKMKDRIAAGDKIEDLQPYIRKVALDIVKSGVRDREPLLDKLHEEIKKVSPDITRENTRDILSGYGDFKRLDLNADKASLRAIQQESMKLAQVEATQRKELPKASGVERQAPNQETRRLTKLVNEGKKALAKLGIFKPSADPEARLKSILDTRKTQTKNAISDLQTEIDTKTRTIKGQSVPISDAELTTLREQLKAKREERDALLPKPGMTDAQRLELATKAAKRSFEQWTERLDLARRGKFNDPATNRIVSGPELDAVRAQAKAAKAEYDQLKGEDPAQKKLANEADNRAYQAALARRAADLTDRMARQDFTPTAKRPEWRDTKSLSAKLAFEKNVKAPFETMRDKALRDARPAWEKRFDLAARVTRFNVLSGPITFLKLAKATMDSVMFKPLTEMAGGVLSHTPIAKNYVEPVQGGGFLVKGYARALARGATQGISDAIQKWRSPEHKSDLDLIWGKPGSQENGPLEITGISHGAVKAPLFRFSFEYSMAKQAENLMRAGQDISDPKVQMEMGTRAYAEGMKSLFQEDNLVSSATNAAIARFEAKNKEGHIPVTGKALATAARVVLPVAKVGTNIVTQTLDHMFGLYTGGAQALYYRKAVDSISVERKAQIMQSLKRGSIGQAAFLLGAAAPAVFGGFYNGKRDKDEVPAGAMRVGGWTLPAWMLHHPIWMVAQAGATMRREGPLSAAAGTALETPVVNEFYKASGALNPYASETGKGTALGRMASGILIPQILQYAAKITDEGEGPDPGPVSNLAQRALGARDTVPRKPEGFGDTLKMGVPGLRQKVPENTGLEKQDGHARIVAALRKNVNDPAAKTQRNALPKSEQDAINDAARYTSDKAHTMGHASLDKALAELAKMSPAERQQKARRNTDGISQTYVAMMKQRINASEHTYAEKQALLKSLP